MKKIIIFFILKALKLLRSVLTTSEDFYKILFIPSLENWRWNISKWKALLVYEKTKKTVPAYKDFIEKNKVQEIGFRKWDPKLELIPITDKENYVKKYSIESRCINGYIPSKGVVIDESSGTSGTANNWVRGPSERRAVKRALQIATHYSLGNETIFLINAFALGPWATGMNVSMSLVDISILKSTGPDIKKIENTLNFFGPDYKYVIMGYPPFLKSLVDQANIEWNKYNIMAVFGGEGLTENMRNYLYKYFKHIYGSYGASDLEINIAAENDDTIAIRKAFNENKELYNTVIPEKYRSYGLPMIFQYNPLDYYIESNDEGELIITLCRSSNLAPKLRYNIHDTGFVLRSKDFKNLSDKTKQLNLKAELPLLFHFGRADNAIAFYGCKITPSNIEEVIFSFPELAKQINSFSLIISEDENTNKRLELALEIIDGIDLSLWVNDEVASTIFTKLKEINQDFREVEPTVPENLKPSVSLYNMGKGPFTQNDIRLKKHYIIKE